MEQTKKVDQDKHGPRKKLANLRDYLEKHLLLPKNKKSWFEYIILSVILIEAVAIVVEVILLFDPEYGVNAVEDRELMVIFKEVFKIDGNLVGDDLTKAITDVFSYIHYSVLGIFIGEAVFKIFVFGKRYIWWPRRPEISHGHIFDLVIIVSAVAAITALWIFETSQDEETDLQSMGFAANALLFLRIARLLRILRVATVSAQFEQVISTLFRSAPTFLYIGLLLILLFFVYALAGNIIFFEIDSARWGSIENSTHTLFQLLTLEGWPEMKNSLALNSENEFMGTYALIFLGSFIIIANFIILSMVIATLTKRSEDEAGKDPETRILELVRGWEKIDFEEVLKYEEEPKDPLKRLDNIKYMSNLEVLKLALNVRKLLEMNGSWRIFGKLNEEELKNRRKIQETLVSRLFKTRKYKSLSIMLGYQLGLIFDKEFDYDKEDENREDTLFKSEKYVERINTKEDILEIAITNKKFGKGFCDAIGRRFQDLKSHDQILIIKLASNFPQFHDLLSGSIGFSSSELGKKS